jgi:hypothetical protein
VDLSGDGGVTRQLLKEGGGAALREGDVAVVTYEGAVKGSGSIFSKVGDPPSAFPGCPPPPLSRTHTLFYPFG